MRNSFQKLCYYTTPVICWLIHKTISKTTKCTPYTMQTSTNGNLSTSMTVLHLRGVAPFGNYFVCSLGTASWKYMTGDKQNFTSAPIGVSLSA